VISTAYALDDAINALHVSGLYECVLRTLSFILLFTVCYSVRAMMSLELRFKSHLTRSSRSDSGAL